VLWRLFRGRQLIRDKLLTISGSTDVYIGEQEFLSPGYYRWTVPLAVRRIHAVCIGAGAYTDYQVTRTYEGGGAGGLCWANDIEVSPGEELLIKVGSPDNALYGSDLSDTILGRIGPDPINDPTSFSEILLEAEGGSHKTGGSFDLHGQNGGGAKGGDGSNYGGFSGEYWGGAGGGAAGYLGNGGDGKVSSEGAYSHGGAAGSGAGAGGVTYWRRASGVQYGHYTGSAGGGVGVKGVGATGSSAPVQASKATPKRGAAGSGGEAEKYGAGGANVYGTALNMIPDYAKAGGGAVRIIWGIKYSYPSNADVSE
jgi:hypothetical protein